MLKRYIFIVLICSFCLSCSYIDDIVYDSSEHRWLYELSSSEYMGRRTGTNGCKKASEYLVKELREMEHDVHLQTFSFKDILMRNIITYIPGTSDSLVVFGAHYDGAIMSKHHNAANDNLSGVITILSIAQKLTHTNDSVLLCLWDGEESTSQSVFNGSRYFISNFADLAKIKWYCNFDTCGSKTDLVCLYYSEQLSELFPHIDEYLNQKYTSFSKICSLQGYSRSDYVSFRERQIPIWGWSDPEYKLLHTKEDTKDIISIKKIQDIALISIDIMNLL